MDKAQESATISDLLGTCHSICEAIEERLRSIVVSPEDETPGTAAAEQPAGNYVTVLECDLADVSGLSARLRRIENHIALAQERLKALA